MEKNVQVSILLDFYSELLTDKQANTIELYYNHDLSLSEISEHLDITRQAVRDSIKRGERVLFELEEKLGLVKRFNSIQQNIRTIEKMVQTIEEINNQKLFSTELKSTVGIIKQTLGEIRDK